jgi:Cu-Zn family superoxide dismutase
MKASRTMLLAAAAALALFAGTFIAHAGGGGPEAKATLRDGSGAAVGTVWLQEEDGAIGVRAVIQGLAPGFHGFHIHAVGNCDVATGFVSAGGHFNPDATAHGSHAGDQPVLLVMSDGSAFARFASDRYAIAQLFDADGSAFIVHAGSDNYANIPTRYSASGAPGPDASTLATGDAGARVACGVIQPG